MTPGGPKFIEIEGYQKVARNTTKSARSGQQANTTTPGGPKFIEIEGYQKVARNTTNSATREPRPQGLRDTKLAFRGSRHTNVGTLGFWNCIK